MAVSAEMPRLQPCPSVSVPPPRQGYAAPGCRPPLTRLQERNLRARVFGDARFPRFLAAIDIDQRAVVLQPVPPRYRCLRPTSPVSRLPRIAMPAFSDATPCRTRGSLLYERLLHQHYHDIITKHFWLWHTNSSAEGQHIFVDAICYRVAER
jgi:hypothetical protein